MEKINIWKHLFYKGLILDIQPVYVILQNKRIYKFFYKICDLNTSHWPFCLKRIRHNLYWEIKFLKQAIYITFVIAKLSKFFQISLQISSDSFLQRILWKLKRPGTSFQTRIFLEFFDKKFSLVILHRLQISLADCVYFPSYSVKYVWCFLFGHLMTSWHLNIWKVKIWLSKEWKELLK